MRQTNQNACITAVLEKIAEQLPKRLKSPGNICNMALGWTFLPQDAGSNKIPNQVPSRVCTPLPTKKIISTPLCITPTAILSLVSLYLPRSKNTKRISTLRPVRNGCMETNSLKNQQQRGPWDKDSRDDEESIPSLDWK